MAPRRARATTCPSSRPTPSRRSPSSATIPSSSRSSRTPSITSPPVIRGRSPQRPTRSTNSSSWWTPSPSSARIRWIWSRPSNGVRRRSRASTRSSRRIRTAGHTEGPGAFASGPFVRSPPASALDGAGESRHVVLDEERVDDGHGDGAEQGARHELSPEVDVAANQLGDHSHGHRLLLRRGEKDQGVDELVPGQSEGEDPRGEDARYGDGKDDADHGPEVAHEEPRAEGDEEGRIGEDEGPRRVAELEGPDDVGERDEEQGGRHEICDEDRGADGARHGEAEPPEGIAGEEPAEERDGGGETRNEEGVPQPVRECRLPEEIDEVLEGGIERPERRVVGSAPGAVELGVGTDRGDEHPVEGEQGTDHEDGQRDVEVHPLLPAPLDDHSVPGGSAGCRSSPGPPHQLDGGCGKDRQLRVGGSAGCRSSPGPPHQLDGGCGEDRQLCVGKYSEAHRPCPKARRLRDGAGSAAAATPR